MITALWILAGVIWSYNIAVYLRDHDDSPLYIPVISPTWDIIRSGVQWVVDRTVAPLDRRLHRAANKDHKESEDAP